MNSIPEVKVEIKRNPVVDNSYELRVALIEARQKRIEAAIAKTKAECPWAEEGDLIFI